jgi:mannan endo-1,4-beta-mannosidase
MLAVALPSAAIPSGDPAAKSPGRSPSLYWGAWIGSQLTGTEAPWDMRAVSKFRRLARKPLSIVHFASPFANCASSPCWFYDFPTATMRKLRQRGFIPFFSWASQSIPGSAIEPDFQLSDVIDGTYDAHIRSFATAVKNWGHPFFLRFNYEMNGDWFPWSERANGNAPGEYVAAWRHVHKIFTSAGATNATWVWCPNVDPDSMHQSLRPLYPGDAYVDWTCLDGYNPGGTKESWRSFGQLYRSTYDRIIKRIAPTKPMIIGEVASSEHGGSKARWIRRMLRQIPTKFPKIRGLLWFENNAYNMDWPIETSRAAVRAFRRGIRRRAYAINAYAHIAISPIRPPG